MAKEKILKIKLSTLIIFILIVLLVFLSILLLVIGKNKEAFLEAKKNEPIQSPSEVLNNENTEYSNNVSENIVVNNTDNLSNNTTKEVIEVHSEQSIEENSTDVDEETIRTLFSKYLDTFKTKSDSDSLKITAYSIPTINIYTGEIKAKIIEDNQEQYYKITDTLAEVYYDIKPYDINNCSGWFSGKEPYEDRGWLRGKLLFVRVRDGILEVMGTSF
jgi:hypothetical protein